MSVKLTVPFCGLDTATGLPVPTPEGKVGYCRTSCRDTALALEDGVWVCHSDSSVMDHD